MNWSRKELVKLCRNASLCFLSVWSLNPLWSRHDNYFSHSDWTVYMSHRGLNKLRACLSGPGRSRVTDLIYHIWELDSYCHWRVQCSPVPSPSASRDDLMSWLRGCAWVAQSKGWTLCFNIWCTCSMPLFTDVNGWTGRLNSTMHQRQVDAAALVRFLLVILLLFNIYYET